MDSTWKKSDFFNFNGVEIYFWVVYNTWHFVIALKHLIADLCLAVLFPTDASLSNTVAPQKKFHLHIKPSGGPGGTDLGLDRGQLF